jgi:hypothetical protein
MGITYGAETGYPSGAPEFTQVISGVCVTRSLVFCVPCDHDHDAPMILSVPYKSL